MGSIMLKAWQNGTGSSSTVRTLYSTALHWIGSGLETALMDDFLVDKALSIICHCPTESLPACIFFKDNTHYKTGDTITSYCLILKSSMSTASADNKNISRSSSTPLTNTEYLLLIFTSISMILVRLDHWL